MNWKTRLKYLASILLVICLLFVTLWYIQLPDYYTHTSFRESNGSKRVETTLNIVVYKRHFDPDLYQEIADEHLEINGRVNELTLNLYVSRSAMRKSKPYKTIQYDYDNNTQTIK